VLEHSVDEPQRLFTRDFSTLSVATFLAVLPAGMLLPTVPLFAASRLDAAGVGVGLAVGAASLTSFVALPFLGRLGDRRGRRIFLVGPLLVAASAAALHVVPVLGVLVAVRVVSGVGEAMIAVSATTAAADLSPLARRGEAISVFSLAFQGGNAVGPLLATELLATDRYWLVWTAASVSACASAAVARRLPETRPAPDEPRRSPAPLVSRAALPAAVVLGLALVGYGGFNAFAALYARGLGLDRVGFVFLVFAGTVIAVRSFGRTLPDRLGAERCAALALVAIAAGLACIAATGTVAGLFAGTGLAALGHALGFPALMTIAIRRAQPGERGAAVATIAAGSQVAIGAGAVLLGGVAATVGYRAVFVVGAAVAASGLLVLRAAGRPAAAGP
jgi:MFS family permease